MAKKLSELYKAKAEIEKAFVDANAPQPVQKKFKPAENETQFKGGTKTFDRSSHRMGYDGEEAPENKGGTPVDVARKETGIAPYTVKFGEEVERIDELSPKTLKSYVKKASGYGRRSAWGLAQKGEKEEDKSMSTDGNKYPEKQERHQKAASKLYHKSNNREKGHVLARHKLNHFGFQKGKVVLAKESIMESFNYDEAEEIMSEDEVIETLFEMLEVMLDESERPSPRDPGPKKPPPGPAYNASAVEQSIAASNRNGRKIGKKEAKAIHALLKGRH